MSEALVHIEGRGAPLPVRINGPRATFNLSTAAVEAKAVKDLDPVLLDLMEIASTVFAADGTIPRGGVTRPNMGKDWYRRLDFDIPVRQLDLWQRPEVAAALCEAVETLTEDIVSFRFRAAVPGPLKQSYLDLDPAAAKFHADEVVLFSGGLDSFAGALELLATTSSRVVLVTHRSAQKAIPRQVDLGKYLAQRFPDRVLHIHVLARRVDDVSRDSTQRSRTLLFAALGHAVAHAFGAPQVSFFENGIVSHNLPLSPQIVATMATRTTHPLALSKINRLMQLVLPDGPPIQNKFKWLTKSDVVSRIGTYGAATQIARAVSCTSIRDQNTLQTHCGACTQCMDRRFAILHAGLAEYDPPESYAIDILFGERSGARSMTMAVEWVRHALRLGELDAKSFMERFGYEAGRIFRGHPNLPTRTALDFTLEMHRRQSSIVRTVLEKALHDRAKDLIAQSLPATSLVRLHLGSGSEVANLVPRYRNGPGSGADLKNVDEVDEIYEAGAPLRVAFSEERGRRIVDVIGLATLMGPPARVPYALKPVFDEDKRNGVAPTDYRYSIATKLPDLADMNKLSIRKAVERCRRQLAKEYRQLHGEPPARHLLIQTQPSKGYRLDPTVVVVDSNAELLEG